MTILLTAVMDGNMKKQLLIISIIVVIVSIFVSCSVNKEGNIQLPSTTAVTDEQGTTHYYQPVTENKSTSVFAEIVTDDKGKAVTKKNGEYVTKEHTTILTTTENTTSSKESKSSTADKQQAGSTTNLADNEIEFKTSTNKNTTTTRKNTTKPTEKETAQTTAPTTKVVTDKDGWIDKWY